MNNIKEEKEYRLDIKPIENVYRFLKETTMK